MKIKINTADKGINWQLNTTYSIEVENNTFIDVDGVGNTASTVGTITTNSTGPSIHITDPVQGATGNTKEYEIEIQMNRSVELGTGNIRLYQDDSTLIKTWIPSELDVHDDKIYLDAFGHLQPNNNYFIQIDSGLIKDVDGFTFGGITNDEDYTISNGTFTTPSTSYITHNPNEGVYNTTTPTLITNTPNVIPSSSNSNLEVEVLLQSNSAYLNGFEFDEYLDMRFHQTILAPDPDAFQTEYFGGITYRGQLSNDNLFLTVPEYRDKDSAGGTTIGSVYTYRRDSENDNFTNPPLHTLGAPSGVQDFGINFAMAGLATTAMIVMDSTGANLYRYGGSGSGFNNLSRRITLTGSPGGCDISDNGDYVVFADSEVAGSGDETIQIWLWDGSAYNLEQEITYPGPYSNSFIKQPKINSDGTILTFLEYEFDSSDVLIGTYVQTWTRSGTTWTSQARTLVNNENYSVSGNLILIENKIYEYDSSGFNLFQTLDEPADEVYAICKDGSKIFSKFRRWTYNANTNQYDKSDDYIDLYTTNRTTDVGTPYDYVRSFTPNFDRNVSHDGNYFTYGHTGTTSGICVIEKLKDKVPTITSNSATITGKEDYVYKKLSSIKLDISDSIPADDLYDYDGEIKIRYKFDTSVSGGEGIGILYRYQRVYKQ